MAIKLSKTFEVITEESAANGDTVDSGFSWQAMPHNAHEVVDLIEGCEPSQWPITDPLSCWFTEYGDVDHATDETYNTSIHLDRSNTAGAKRAWVAAIKAAGFEIKGY